MIKYIIALIAITFSFKGFCTMSCSRILSAAKPESTFFLDTESTLESLKTLRRVEEIDPEVRSAFDEEVKKLRLESLEEELLLAMEVMKAKGGPWSEKSKVELYESLERLVFTAARGMLDHIRGVEEFEDLLQTGRAVLWEQVNTKFEETKWESYDIGLWGVSRESIQLSIFIQFRKTILEKERDWITENPSYVLVGTGIKGATTSLMATNPSSRSIDFEEAVFLYAEKVEDFILIAKKYKVSLNRVFEEYKLQRSLKAISLTNVEAVEALASTDLISREESASVLRRSLLDLSAREERILRLHFFKGFTLEEIAKELGITRERTRQIEVAALIKLEKKSALRRLKRSDL